MDVKYGIWMAIALGMSVLDIATGYIRAVMHNDVKSSVMRSGLLKKVAIVLVMAMCCLLQYAQQFIDLGITIPILSVACAFIILMEATSILENANDMLDGKLTSLIYKILPKKEENDSEEESK